MAKTFISLGSNIKNRYINLTSAIKEINYNVGKVLKISDIWETQSWNYNDKDYLNTVIEIETEKNPKELLLTCKKIEIKLGRTSKTKIINGRAYYTARIIDIDIIFYENIIISTEKLTIPHPHIQNRMFVLKPLLQIAPKLTHPILKKSIEVLTQECVDKGKIKIFKSNFQNKLLSELKSSTQNTKK